MRPVHEVLNRIRWDPEFDGGRRFALSYVDHSKAIPVIVPFSYITFDAGSSRMIGLVDPDGDMRKIPMHRIREVFRDGMVIWRRPDRPRPAVAAASATDLLNRAEADSDIGQAEAAQAAGQSSRSAGEVSVHGDERRPARRSSRERRPKPPGGITGTRRK